MKTLFASLLTTLAIMAVPAQAVDIAKLTEQLNNPSRPEADKARDAGRKPAQVLDFFGVEEGMTVIDLVAAAGYYTEVLSYAVGPNGTVYMQNSPASLTGERGSRTDAAINERLANNRLPNVRRLDRDFDNLGLAPNSIDFAIIALEIHELFRSADPDAPQKFFDAMMTYLKPGGVLGITEHAGNPENDLAAQHRGDENAVAESAMAAGFIIDDTSDLLRNPADDRSTGVFDASVRGMTDRFVMRLQKPE